MLTSMPPMCRIHRHRRTHTSTVVKHMNECTHMHARHARTHGRAHAYTHVLKCIRPTWIYQLDGRRNEGTYLYTLFVWSSSLKRKKEEKQICSQNLTQICILLLLFFFFFFFFFLLCFTVVSGQPLRSYTPCNQVYKRGQQNACTHWSTTACDVIRHPKTTLARWSILPTKLICLMCRFVLCQQYVILFWPEVSFFFFFFLHSLSICLSVFFQASFSWVFFFFFFLSLIIDGRLPFLLGVKMTHYPGSILITLKFKTFLPAAIFFCFLL